MTTRLPEPLPTIRAVKRKMAIEGTPGSRELGTMKSLATQTPRDCELANAEFGTIASPTKLADRILKMLTDQKGLGLGCQVDLYEHGLQTATRCFHDVRARTPADAEDLTPAGLTLEDEELVVVALLHDIGETLSPINHGEVAASILRPHISPRNFWILENHEIFQLYYYGDAAGAKDKNLRDQLKASPHWDACEEFCLKWDQAAFDGEYEMFPLEFFDPMVRRVLARPAYAYKDHKDELINRLKAGLISGFPTQVAEGAEGLPASP